MSARTRSWLRSFLHLGARAMRDNIPEPDILRQEDTALRALDLLDDRPGILIGDEVGMGKTFEALAVIAAFRHRNPKSRIVIITPGPDLNVKWRNEFNRFSAADARIYDFGGDVAAATSVAELVAAAANHAIVVVPVSVFNSTRGGWDQSYILSLYAWWKGLHGLTVNALFRRFREGQLKRVDVTATRFLDHAPLSQIEPHLERAFRAGDDADGAMGLDELYSAPERGIDAFGQYETVRRAIDLARFRLVRALLPPFDLLVLDEAHKLKNADTVRSQAVMTVFQRHFDKALFLTATPFQLDIAELNQVFALFGVARSAPADLNKEVEELFAAISEYQEAYRVFEAAWKRIDPELAVAFARAFDADPTLTIPVGDKSLQLIVEHARRLLSLKRSSIEPRMRRWIIRSLREDKRQYRWPRTERLDARGEAALPFLLYERFIAELFRSGDGTHKAAVQVNMVSSYGAARTGMLLEEGARALPPEADAYRAVLREVLHDLERRPIEHPKVDFVIHDALEAAERGEKTLVFCARVETLREMSDELGRLWEKRLVEHWRRAVPRARPEDIFDERGEDNERSIGLHSRLRKRFHAAQDALYLALRERYLRSLLPAGDWASENLDDIVRGANERLRGLRTSATSAQRLDYRLMKRCVEQATIDLWRRSRPAAPAPHSRAIDAICSPEFLELGLDRQRDALENDETGTEPCAWTITPQAALLVVGERPHLWEHLAPLLSDFDYELRVHVVERLARYLTYKEVPFLADLMASAAATDLDAEQVESLRLLEHVDHFWATVPGRRWVDRLSAFLRYFVARDRQHQLEIFEGPIKTGQLARQTRDGESRERLREAFNTPLYPMILIANEVMQEGLDLHRSCRRVVHHDLAWNPAQLEQRVGRVDRLGSLTLQLRQSNPDAKLEVLYPLIRRTIDERQYRTVKMREKWLEFLLGRPPEFNEYSLDDHTVELPARFAQSLAIDLRPERAKAAPVDVDVAAAGGDGDGN